MESRLNELQYILEKLLSVHRTLLDVLDEEHAHMVSLEIEALGEASKTKEVLLAEIWNLEQLRKKIVDEISIECKLNPATVTLKELSLALGQRIEGPGITVLVKTREALNMLIEQARDRNKRNMTFAEESLARIEELKRNVLGVASSSSPENYSSQGTRQPIAEQGGRLLSTEA
ncbi:MAG TPA: flagellar export chaperone FlgN [Oligoflexia bacterium]|mgnify:CR=1 FL=1|nr:flagellar export chaperone FlgN [Oligoflexia bacterium]